MNRIMLLRYDTERSDAGMMAGFLDTVLDVHRGDAIPVSMFCLGHTLENRADEFRAFYKEVAGDALFDMEDHSYSHIGMGYEAGPSIEELLADYEKSFRMHREVFGKDPFGTSMCGTSGRDGASLSGFDATEKSRREFEMVASLGVKMISSFLSGIDRSCCFHHFGRLGRADIMGFPSNNGDTGWMRRKEFGDPMEYILAQIRQGAEAGRHIAVVMHDWVAWNHAPDKKLTHVRLIAEAGRRHGYELRTHRACYDDGPLWQELG
jgi:peptidoglycan/xylan/chitin deacetylase (PgdA/CDA1 family)